MYYHNMAGDELGKFGLKKIKRAVSKAAKTVGKAVVLPSSLALKATTSAVKTLAKPVVGLVGATGKATGGILSALTSSIMPGGATPDSSMPGSDAYQPGYNQYGQQPGQGGGYGDSPQGDQGMFGGISPLMIGLAVGVPAILFFMMKGKK